MAPLGSGIRALLCLAALCFAEGFSLPRSRALRHAVVMSGGRKATPLGRATTPAGKRVKDRQHALS